MRRKRLVYKIELTENDIYLIMQALDTRNTYKSLEECKQYAELYKRFRDLYTGGLEVDKTASK